MFSKDKQIKKKEINFDLFLKFSKLWKSFVEIENLFKHPISFIQY